MVILSIDSSIAKIGWAAMDDSKPVGATMLKGSGTLKIPAIGLGEKTQKISESIQKLIEDYGAEAAVIEKPEPFTYGRSKRYNRPLNQKSMAKNNIAVGIISAACAGKGLETHFLSAQDWKGSQQKELTIFNVNTLFNTKITKSKHDEADAIKMGQVFIENRRLEQLTGKQEK